MVTTALASVKQGFGNANNTYVIPQGTLAEKAGKNVAGGWWHKSTYNNQMWLDGAYMGSALLAQLTQFYGNSDNVFGSKEADLQLPQICIPPAASYVTKLFTNPSNAFAATVL